MTQLPIFPWHGISLSRTAAQLCKEQRPSYPCRHGTVDSHHLLNRRSPPFALCIYAIWFSSSWKVHSFNFLFCTTQHAHEKPKNLHHMKISTIWYSCTRFMQWTSPADLLSNIQVIKLLHHTMREVVCKRTYKKSTRSILYHGCTHRNDYHLLLWRWLVISNL